MSTNPGVIEILERSFGELIGIYEHDGEPPEYIFEDQRLDLIVLEELKRRHPEHSTRFLAYMLVDRENDLEYTSLLLGEMEGS